MRYNNIFGGGGGVDCQDHATTPTLPLRFHSRAPRSKNNPKLVCAKLRMYHAVALLSLYHKVTSIP